MPNLESIENLTNRMVHDVRTPVTILNMLYSTFEQKLPKTQDSAEELNILKEEAAKIDKIVSDYRENLRNLLKQ